MSLWIVAYVLGYAAMVRIVAGHLAWFSPIGDRPDGFEWSMAVVGAALICVAWPLVAAYLMAGSLLPLSHAEREGKKAIEVERQKQLERELGLDV